MASAPLPVVERFVSLNGEGRFAGYPACFIRFAGCNLACSYCDTAWANAADVPSEAREPSELAEWVRARGCAHVTLTGGEPLLQPRLPELITKLAAVPSVAVIEVETNGSLPLDPLIVLRNPKDGLTSLGARLCLTVDYKLPSSGMESAMAPHNFALVGADDVVKFVVGDYDDLERMEMVLRRFDLPAKTMVIASPVFGAIEPAAIADFLIERRLFTVRLQLQLHKLIWPATDRGV